MREIKFRAWNKNRKIMYSSEELGVDQLTISCDGRGFINVNGRLKKLSEYYNHIIPMQYTGLKDKNGKEIYEGDICREYLGEHEILAPMIWNSNKAQFGLEAVVDFESPSHVELTGKPEVVGNIYENPEMLKK